MIVNLIVYAIIGAAVYFAFRKYGHLFGGMGGINPQAMQEANRVLLEKTGFRHSSLPEGNMEEQLRLSNQLSEQAQKTGQMEMELERLVDNHWIRFRSSQKVVGANYTISANWDCFFQNTPHAYFHIADKDLTSLKKEVTTGYSRNWAPVYSETVSLQDPELSKRFQVYSQNSNPQVIQQILSQPETKQALLAMKEVDLCVYQDRISFADPTQENLRNALGGTAGMLKGASDIVGMMEKQIVFQDKMAHFLVRFAKNLGV